MHTRTQNLSETYTERLSRFESSLSGTGDEESSLPELRSAIRAMLSGSGTGESDVRAILHKRFEAGELRRETFTLALKILDRIVVEEMGLSPGASSGDDVFAETMVLNPQDTPHIPETDNELQVGSILRDRFLLQEEVAGGSMGVVYKALDRRLAEADSESPYVAIKVLAPKLARNGNALRALQQEAAKGRCLTHPNIVRFIDLDREDELYFVVMEWLDGRSLAEILDSNQSGALDQDTALDIVRNVGTALAYAHRCGVVHADVKPGNIIITPSGDVKLFDFGVARVRQKEQQGRPAFDPGVLNAHTAAYSSMQVISGEDPVPADDIFSLGCLMYRLIAGYRVFGPRNAAEAADSGMNPERPQGLSDTHWSALRKALSYSRVTRFASVEEFLAALDRAAEKHTEEIVVPNPAFAAESRTGWSWKMTALIAIVLIAIALVTQDRLLSRLRGLEANVATIVDDPVEVESSAPLDEIPPEAEEVLAAVPEEVSEIAVQELPVVDAVVVEEVSAPVAEIYEPVDYSPLPPADLVVELAGAEVSPRDYNLALLEDGGGAIVDLVRSRDLSATLSVRLREVNSTGNQLPSGSGQYRIDAGGIVSFQPGQKRARTSIAMVSDPIREEDQQASLVVSDIDNDKTIYAVVNLRLDDDDQRKFGAALRPNTVAFAAGEVVVRELEAAVQIDVLRFKGNNTRLDVGYVVQEISAIEGKDYFAEATNTVSFGPGQLTAKILIPLVQDEVPESDEVFVLELITTNPVDDPDLFSRTTVKILDDDF